MWSHLKNSFSSIRDSAVQAYEENFGDQAQQGGLSAARRNLSYGHSGSGSLGSTSGSNVIKFLDRSVRLLNQIAEGGYSTVFLGEDVADVATGLDARNAGHLMHTPSRGNMPRRYAVKRIACGGKEQLAEAKKEIDVMERLGSSAANVLPLIGHTRSTGSGPAGIEYVYMLFDLYDGNVWDVVQARIQVGRYLSDEELGGIFRQLCLALDAMHSAGMAHRDVKPHNILLKDVDSYPYGKWSKVSGSPAVLMDFGSVTDERVVISDRRSALQTQENAERFSTAPYRAPELWDVASSCVIDGKVDVWAAGCVLYYMIVGETPFERISNQAGGSLMLSVLNGSYTWPDKVHVSSKYANIVDACLTVDPAMRPNIREVLEMIDGHSGAIVDSRRLENPGKSSIVAAVDPQPSLVTRPPAPTRTSDSVPNLIDL